MHREHEVIRLELETVHVNYSYLLEQMAPDEVLQPLAVRRLLTPEKVGEVQKMTSRHQKIVTVLEAINAKQAVGTLLTFCEALASTARQEHIAENLTQCELITLLHVCKHGQSRYIVLYTA